MGMIRAFIAINLSDEVKSWLDNVIDQLSNRIKGVRWVRTKNMHLTIRFLGDIEESLAPKIGAAIEKIAEGMPEFQLRFGGLGTFPNSQRPRVIWIGVQDAEDEPLRRLYEAIESVIDPLGIPRESKRRFHPHLTLGRVRERRQTVRFSPEQLPDSGGTDMTARTVTLFRSELLPRGPLHTALAVGKFKEQRR